MGSLIPKPTRAQMAALRWLADHGGHARLDQYANAWAGECKAPFAAETWLRLMISGHLAQSMRVGHFGITMAGLKAIGR